jgi:hypothetical protein
VLQMDLPQKPPSDPLPAALQAATTTTTSSSSCDAGPPSGAMQQLLAACVGKLPVEAVQFNADLKYVLVVLKEAGGSSPSTLQQLSPDAAGLLGALSSEDITGLIVTCRGGWCWCWCWCCELSMCLAVLQVHSCHVPAAWLTPSQHPPPITKLQHSMKNTAIRVSRKSPQLHRAPSPPCMAHR